MITTLDAIDFIYQVLVTSPIKEAISGGIYKLVRPISSDKEDIVVNSLPVVNGDLQEGIANVNVHVPNLNINTGSQDDTTPDFARMKVLAEMVRAALEDVWLQDESFRFTIQQQHTFYEPETESNYINFRIKYFSVNLPNF